MPDATKKSYKDTLNLPKTPFPMKANLVQNEPASLRRWHEQKLYAQLRQRGGKRYVFHDGPPYANGSIHLGHLLNKCLKDFVVRSRGMMGFDVPYTPGWDCHGLPIEHKVVQELGEKSHEMQAIAIRRKCKASAEKFVKLQSQQMQRLLTLADYEAPYLTMDPAYEAATLEVFADLVGKGLVYRALKPVHWSIDNQTALAEAELEYYDREDTSVFVLFDRTDGQGSLMIWTTTPWTLPANLAVAVSPNAEYGVYDVAGRKVLIACDLASKVLRKDMPPIATCRGSDLTRLTYTHPFIERVCPLVTADYVTLEDGCGLVHTAPGHGVEDYQTGLKHKLDIYCPVRADGTFDDTVPTWLRGKTVWQANDLVVEQLRSSGHLFRAEKFTHSYPHDWRGKTPVIFRATEQWFISVDRQAQGATLRKRALERTASEVRFIPEWGRNRMRGMLESRPDWCVSRQRSWGLPIPAFYNADGDALLTRASVLAVAKVIAQHGSDAWFTQPPEVLLAGYDPANDPDAPQWCKARAGIAGLTTGNDIFDVWFDSGCSWHAALKRMQGDYPADLYLEGSDQHRGWFQVSLLPALAVTGQPPFRAVLTHGFMVDKDGRKMSKSLGNTLEVEELLKEFGADVCRWWVASLNFENDIKVDHDFFRVAGEEYRKVRNTIRYLLSNLYDYKPDINQYTFTNTDATSPDAWVLGELNNMIDRVRGGYESYNFALVRETIFTFCNSTLSAKYLSGTKDRLYCDDADSSRRRRTQTAMHYICSALVRLLAPIQPHTADEAWLSLLGAGSQSVHLQLFPELVKVHIDEDWPLVWAIWDFVADPNNGDLERVRQEQNLAPLECGIILHVPSMMITRWSCLDRFDPVDIADLMSVSRFAVRKQGDPHPNTFHGFGQENMHLTWCTSRPDNPTVEIVDLRNASQCARSWKRDGTVKSRSDGGMLSDRDAAAIGLH